MVNKPRPQTLRDRIEKRTQFDGLDSGWEQHFEEVGKALAGIGPIEEFSLLSQDSARAAELACASRLKELTKVLKQVRAVKHLAEAKKAEALGAVENLPWPSDIEPTNEE